MSGYFERLIARAAGQAPVLRPKLRALFEPPPGQTETDLPDAMVDSDAALRTRASAAAPEGPAPVAAMRAAEPPSPVMPRSKAGSAAAAASPPPVAATPGTPAPAAQPAPAPIRQITQVTHETRVRVSETNLSAPPVPLAPQADRQESPIGRATPRDAVRHAKAEPPRAERSQATPTPSVPHETRAAPSPAQAAPPTSTARASQPAPGAAPPIVTRPPRPAPLVPTAPQRQADRSAATAPEAPPVVIRIGRIDVHTAPSEAPGPRLAPPVRPSPPQHAGPSLADFLAGTGKR